MTIDAIEDQSEKTPQSDGVIGKQVFLNDADKVQPSVERKGVSFDEKESLILGETKAPSIEITGLEILDQIESIEDQIEEQCIIGYYHHKAAELLKTDSSNGRLGVEFFNGKIRSIYHAIRGDNPIADQVLLNIEEAMKNWQQELLERTKELDAKTSRLMTKYNSQSVTINNGYTYAIKVPFDTFHGIRLALILTKFDEYISALKRAQACGVYSGVDVSNHTFQMRKGFLGIINMANQFKNKPLSRRDIADVNETALEALTANQKITVMPDVLLCQRRSEAAPPINGRYNNKVDDIRAGLNKFIKLMIENQEVELPKVKEF